MTVKTLQSLVANRPFRPFTLRLANGQRFRISDHNRVAVHPEGKTLILFEHDGGLRILDIPLIAELQTK